MSRSIVLCLALLGCGGGGAKPAPAPAPAAAPAAAAPAPDANAVELAAKDNEDGKQAMFSNQYPAAEAKFKSALARDPKAIYSFNLCVARFQQGTFAGAKTACTAAQALSPEPSLADKITHMLEKIDTEAKKQGISL